MMRPINGLSMVSQRAMLVAKGPCVSMNCLFLSSGDEEFCLRNLLFLRERAAELGQRNVL
jgi:hypothetical protein